MGDYFKEEGTNKQAIANRLAIQSIKSLARLGGYLSEPDVTPDNPIVNLNFNTSGGCRVMSWPIHKRNEQNMCTTCANNATIPGRKAQVLVCAVYRS